MDYDAADRVTASERAKAERRATIEARREMINIEIAELQRRQQPGSREPTLCC
jgi:hypothetical protein